jgi:DHA2 family multidrug resistance protein
VLKNRNFTVGTGIMTVLGIVLYGTIALLPLFLQTMLGYPAVQSGMAVSPRGFGSIVSMILVGRLIGKIDGRYLVLFGFLVLGYSTYQFSDINLMVTAKSVVWPNIFSGFAMGFIFVPLTTMAMGTLPNEQMGNASGVFNLMRNTGGSVGIAAMTTMLSRGSQIHQAALVKNVNPYDPVTQQRIQELTHALPGGEQQAHGVIYGMVQREAMVLSYIDNFRMLAFLCVICLPAVFLFKRVRKKKGPIAMH